MKKTSKLFGAVALSAALAMGCAAPAFAAAGNENAKDLTLGSTGGTANTYINVETSIDQINVALPLHVTIVAKTSGGVDVPSAGTNGYRIENKSTSCGIKVNSIKVTNNSGAAGSNKWGLISNPITQGTDPTSGSIGDLYLALAMTDADGASNATTDVPLANGVSGTIDGSTLNNWTVGAATSSTQATVRGLKLTGSCSNLKSLYNTDATTSNSGQQVDVFTLTYTVAPQGGSETASGTHEGGNGATHGA